MSNQRTKNQHYVPRLHLRKFTSDEIGGKVWVYDIEKEEFRTSTVENVGSQTNYYSLKRADGTYYDDIDHWLTDIESEAAPIYEHLLQGRMPLGKERLTFSLFLATQFYRTPRRINAAAELIGRQIKSAVDGILTGDEKYAEIIADLEKNPLPNIDIAKLKRYSAQSRNYELSISAKVGLEILKFSEQIAPLIAQKHWEVRQAIGGHFITSDSPVHAATPPRPPGDARPLNFSDPFVQISYPLSPTRMLFITGASAPSGWVLAHEIENFNRARSWDATRHIISHVHDDQIMSRSKLDGHRRLQLRSPKINPQAKARVRR
ncbi:DUF4238 domain-containing protein [Caulobacter sp. BK020]|uniref:DUF4238 domain-containing protein n=1 Tax=Caulobacter sp. BK020 TaxID=2512117 RepID=UPI0010E9E987|nr:DUF4238 domain-containing protein [Caulobacter sp. BK020]TCS13724.1 uncharacterized protein DUF4238 [Caulobacter sp. BK020]